MNALHQLSPRHFRRVLVSALILRADRASDREELAIALASRWRDLAVEARAEAEHWISLAEAGALELARDVDDEKQKRAASLIPLETRLAARRSV